MSTTTALPQLYSYGHALEMADDKVGLLRDSRDAMDDVAELHRRFDTDGYLYIKGGLDRDEVLAARQSLVDGLAEAGVLDESHPRMDGVCKPGSGYVFKPELTNNNPKIQNLLYSGRLPDFYTKFFGENIRHYDFTWLRAIGPGKGTNPHCDLPYMGRGTHRHMTCWLPYGDISFTQRATNSSSFVMLDNAALSGNASARPQVTTSREVESYQTNGSLYHVRFDYGAPNYYLYTEGGVLHYLNSGFNVFVPATGNGVLLHTTTAGNVSAGTTIVDDAYLNNHPERIVLAHHRGNGAVPSINDAISAGYLISKWVLQRNSGANMPVGADFHLYAQDPSINAFFWNTPEVGDTSYTLLDQPVINGEPCAQIYVQQSGTANPHPTQLRYVSALKRWRIENADNVLLPNNTSFMVVVDEAATVACRYDHIFHDGLEVLD